MAHDFENRPGSPFSSSFTAAMQEQIIHTKILDRMVEALVFMDPDMTIRYANQTFFELFRYTENEIIGKSIRKLGIDDNFANLTSGEIAKILREKEYWQGEVLRRDRNGNYIPVLVSAKALFDEEGVLEGFFGTYMDLRRFRQSELRLRNSLNDTIVSLARAIEDRDLYKSKHHSKVNELSVAIALDMGLDTTFIEGLSMAAILHDIGKIYIPSEILNYAGSLTDSEIRLVKTHPAIGYDILKDIDLPWPVAETVLQHHERLDGSGYPNKLRNKEISRGARILAVADVVETMFSDRPHRVGFPLDVCMNEIESHRGTLYDADVVDACLNIVRETRYILKRR